MAGQVEAIIEAIVAARKRRHWSQNQLAERSGYPRACIQDWEARRADPRLSAVCTLMEVLDVEWPRRAP